MSDPSELRILISVRVILFNMPTQPTMPAHRVALIVPCYNEGLTIADVIDQFRAAIPGLQCWVFDNASTDDTASKALAAGARVRRVLEKGKGNVVRRMFADVDADI